MDLQVVAGTELLRTDLTGQAWPKPAVFAPLVSREISLTPTQVVTVRLRAGEAQVAVGTFAVSPQVYLPPGNISVRVKQLKIYLTNILVFQVCRPPNL